MTRHPLNSSCRTFFGFLEVKFTPSASSPEFLLFLAFPPGSNNGVRPSCKSIAAGRQYRHFLKKEDFEDHEHQRNKRSCVQVRNLA